jgi:hypothetical protein
MTRPSFGIDFRALLALTVTVVHEEMHQWTSEHEQEGQETQDVDGVLIDDERRDDEAKSQEDRLADHSPFV